MMEEIRRKRGTIYIVRGLPGTRRSVKASSLWRDGGDIIRAHDYFRLFHGTEDYISKYAHDAHMWARQRAMDCMRRLVDPIIINNPNMPLWHMYPYVAMARSQGYWTEFRLTRGNFDTPLEELERRSRSKVPRPVLKHMRDSYEPVDHPDDVLYDERSQKRWIGSPEMVSNNWWPNTAYLWPDLHQRYFDTWEMTSNNWWPEQPAYLWPDLHQRYLDTWEMTSNNWWPEQPAFLWSS